MIVRDYFPAEASIDAKVYSGSRVIVYEAVVAVWTIDRAGQPFLAAVLDRADAESPAPLHPPSAVGPRAASHVPVHWGEGVSVLHINRGAGCGCGSPLKRMAVPSYGP